METLMPRHFRAESNKTTLPRLAGAAAGFFSQQLGVERPAIASSLQQVA